VSILYQEIAPTFGETGHSAFRYAEETDLIDRNPASRTRPPKVQRVPKQVFTTAQARYLLERCRGHRLELFIWLALSTGLRGGELMRLRWSDVDLAHGQLLAQRGKTPRARRVVALSEEVIQIVRRAWPESQREYVVVSREGAPYAQLGNIRKAWYRLLARHGLPRITVHGLRHTWATLHRELGTSLQTVSEMAGHSSIILTADTYTRSNPDQQREAASRLGQLLGGDRPEAMDSSAANG
jgi:integrase